jgi:hypothetical protein
VTAKISSGGSNAEAGERRRQVQSGARKGSEDVDRDPGASTRRERD